MEWMLYPEEWSLLSAAVSMVFILGLTLFFGVRHRLAWSQLPAATRNEELSTLVAAREAELLDLERQKKEIENEIRGLESRVLERDRLEAQAEYWKSQVEAEKAEHAGLSAMRGEVEKVREEYRQTLEKLAETQTQLGEVRGELDDARGRAEAVARQLADTDRDIEDRSQNLTALRREFDETQALATKARTDLTEARRTLEEVRERESGLVREVETLEGRRRVLTDALRQEESQLNGVKEELAGLAGKRRELGEIEETLKAGARKLDERRERVARLESDEKALNARIAQQEAELEGVTDGEDRALADLLTPPACLHGSGSWTDRSSEDESENQTLQRVHTLFRDSGFDFHDRQIKAFHTSLKTASISPLTVLAGISGTGKSQLPRYYAEAMGMHFLKLPVQPRWDGPQDLFGFYNYIERRYRATDLARALVHLDPYNWPKEAKLFKERMLLVLLDEMNLARVEHYFSEFLSRLEGRPLDDGATDGASRAPSQIEIDVSRQGQPRRVYVGQNVLFVGTMNEDESTQSLSDKVLDRANLLRFPKPEELKAKLPEPKASGRKGYLPKSRWQRWIRKASDLKDFQRARDYVQEVNTIMDDMGRPFGHRTGQAMLHYAANYPDRQDPHALEASIGDQIELRILPRLRGVSKEEYRQPLDALHKFVDRKLSDEKLAKALRISLDSGPDNSDLFVWRGLTR